MWLTAARRGLLLTTGLAVGSWGAYRVTDVPNQPLWLRQNRAAIDSVGRTIRTVGAGAYVSLDYKWVEFKYANSPKEYEEEMKKCHTRSADLVAKTAIKNGGLYIKLGQTLGSINHVLPEEYVEGLKVLLDRASPQRYEQVEVTFLEEFNKRPDEIFKSFDKVPIAAASMAQVHKAVTQEGETVAVKVQYGDLTDRFGADLTTLTMVLNLVTFFHPKFAYGWVLEEFRDTLFEELDFRLEGKNAEICGEQLKDVKGLYLPKVYWNLTNKRILTAEWIDGCRADDLKGVKALGLKPAEVMKIILETFGKQIFFTGFVHSDPHAANLIIRRNPNNQKKCEAQVVLIDHGLYIRIPRDTQECFAKIWKALVLKQKNILKENCEKLNVHDPNLFVEMILQRPYGDHTDLTDMIKFGIHISQEDIQHMQRKARDRMDEITKVLRAMPRSLILVIRNLNLVRSLNFSLQAPVNRYSYFANCALQAIQQQHSNAGMAQRFSERIELIQFNYNLMKNNLYLWFERSIFSFLKLIGWLPKDLGELDQIVAGA